jgi:hypothetical protein
MLRDWCFARGMRRVSPCTIHLAIEPGLSARGEQGARKVRAWRCGAVLALPLLSSIAEMKWVAENGGWVQRKNHVEDGCSAHICMSTVTATWERLPTEARASPSNTEANTSAIAPRSEAHGRRVGQRHSRKQLLLEQLP